MSGWHRDNPELVGTDADPWMQHESYRKLAPMPESERERLREERELMDEQRDYPRELENDEGGNE